MGDVRCCESRMAKANPLIDRRVVGVVFPGMVQWLQWSPRPKLLDVVSCTASVVVVVA